MASLPIIADVYRVAVNWSAPGSQTATNVMHFYAPTLTATTLFNLLNTNVVTSLWGLAGTTTAITSVQITKLDGSSATQLFSPTGTKWAGPTTAGDYLPAYAVVLSLRTLLRGRSRRGRLFLPFPTEINVSNGVCTAGILAGCAAAWPTFLTAMAAGGGAMVVASYLLELVTTVQTATPVYTLGVQRKRQDRL